MLNMGSKRASSLVAALLIFSMGSSIRAKTQAGHTVRSEAISGRKFFKANNSPHMLQLGGPIGGVKSRIACSALCERQTPVCLSFAYNSTTLTCILGSLVYYDTTARSNTVAGSAVYTSACCPMSKYGYKLKLKSKPSLSRCVFMNNHKKNYKAAQSECGRRWGRLLTAKTEEHYKMFWDMAGKHQTWLGLDDLEGENHFKWSDGTYLTDDVKQRVLKNPDFNDDKGHEHCVHIWKKPFSGKRVLNDAECRKKSFKSICELVTPTTTEKLIHEQCPEME
ncbi:C-type lectin-related protein 2 [Elysia marginata]|uniref:C-type lectin-related protein 2 n=1 Tax=Elysia marginata TaxID=1093978 RepID=A0AAV4ICJ3_9GAST|nr:C-type lectin-related protein 2 [Elysia marginata]